MSILLVRGRLPHTLTLGGASFKKVSQVYWVMLHPKGLSVGRIIKLSVLLGNHVKRRAAYAFVHLSVSHHSTSTFLLTFSCRAQDGCLSFL